MTGPAKDDIKTEEISQERREALRAIKKFATAGAVSSVVVLSSAQAVQARPLSRICQRAPNARICRRRNRIRNRFFD